MSDMLADGEAWLADQQRSHQFRWVHYLRGAASLRVRATKGRSQFDVTDGNEQLTRVDTVDWLIAVNDLELDGLPATPQAGDRIIEGDLQDGEAFEVAAIAGNDVWRWADQERIRFRIHTKHVGEHP